MENNILDVRKQNEFLHKYLSLLICGLLAVGIVVFAHSRNTIFLFSIGTFIICITALKRIGYGLISLPCIFLTLIFVFHCSFFILWLFDYQINNAVIYIIPNETWYEACKFSSLFMLLYTMGANSIKKKIVKTRRVISIDGIKNAGKLLIVIFIIPRIYVDVIALLAFLRNGYLATYSVSLNGFMETFAEGFYFGIIFSILGYRDNQKVCKNLLLFAYIMALIGMLSGRRLEKVVFLVAITIMYFRYVDRKKDSCRPHRKLALFFVGYVFLAFIMTLGDVRGQDYVSAKVFITSFLQNASYKMIFDIMIEFGYTSYTLASTMESFSNMGTGFGINYVSSWVQVIPNIGGIYTSAIESMSYVHSIPLEYQFWLGGSFLGELFYNFGYFSIPLMFIMGRLSGKISYNIDNAMRMNGFSVAAIASVIMVPLLFIWVRGDFSYIPRPLVWYVIFTLLLARIRVQFGVRQRVI